MLDNTKLLLKESKPGEGVHCPAGSYGGGEGDLILVSSRDGRTGLYQSVRGIIYDCDKRPLEPEIDV